MVTSSKYLDKWSKHSFVVIYKKVIFDKIFKAADAFYGFSAKYTG